MTRQRIVRLLIVGAIVVFWGGAFCASLAIAQLDLGYASSLCGEWGCLPPTAPLLSVHAMWFTLIVGGTWLAHLAIPLLRTPAPWLGMTLAALLATLILLGVDVWSYLDKGGAWADVERRGLYSLITWTDLPLVQIIVACSANWCVAAAAAKHSDRAVDPHSGNLIHPGQSTASSA